LISHSLQNLLAFNRGLVVLEKKSGGGELTSVQGTGVAVTTDTVLRIATVTANIEDAENCILWFLEKWNIFSSWDRPLMSSNI